MFITLIWYAFLLIFFVCLWFEIQLELEVKMKRFRIFVS